MFANPAMQGYDKLEREAHTWDLYVQLQELLIPAMTILPSLTFCTSSKQPACMQGAHC